MEALRWHTSPHSTCSVHFHLPWGPVNRDWEPPLGTAMRRWQVCFISLWIWYMSDGILLFLAGYLCVRPFSHFMSGFQTLRFTSITPLETGRTFLLSGSFPFLSLLPSSVPPRFSLPQVSRHFCNSGILELKFSLLLTIKVHRWNGVCSHGNEECGFGHQETPGGIGAGEGTMNCMYKPHCLAASGWAGGRKWAPRMPAREVQGCGGALNKGRDYRPQGGNEEGRRG